MQQPRCAGMTRLCLDAHHRPYQCKLMMLSAFVACLTLCLLAGDYDNAIDYLITMGGIAREDDYEYLGQDNFCKKDFMAYSDKHTSKLIKVKVGRSSAYRVLPTRCTTTALARMPVITTMKISSTSAVHWGGACSFMPRQG